MLYWLACQTFSQVILFGIPNAYLPHPLCTSTHTAVRVFITEMLYLESFQQEPAIGKKKANKQRNKQKQNKELLP